MFKNCLIKIELKKINQYMTKFYLNLFFIILSILIQLSIFNLFLDKNIDNLLWNQTMIYAIMSSGIYNAIAISRVPEFAENIKNGRILKYFIRPIDLFHQIILQEIGNCLIMLAQILPIFFLGIICNFLFLGNFGYIIRFGISLILSIILSILISSVFFSITFITSNYSGPKALLQGVSSLLSGALVPLILWPKRLTTLLKWSPFAVIVDSPIKAYLNLESYTKIILFQLLWCGIFYILGKILFKKLPIYCDYVGG